MRASKPERTDTVKGRNRLLANLRTPKTANEVIGNIFKRDKSKNTMGTWKYYLHLNKLFSPLEKAGLIKQSGTKIGPTNKTEKLWRKI